MSKLANAENNMKRMKWNIFGTSEARWKGEGYIDTDSVNRLYYSGKNEG